MTSSNTTPTPASPVKRALSEIRRLRGELAKARSSSSEPLAIVGFAHRLPGVDPVPEALHPALLGKLDAISEIPADRWNADAFYHPVRGTPGRMYTRRGGFLEDVRGFDPEFFGISPFEATHIDPQQRLLLEVAWEALEHAAIDPTGLRGSPTGVFVGIASNDWGRRSLAGHANAYASVGSAFSVAAGRIAYLLDLRGPALSIDTACSSSLAAAHVAATSLRRRESDLAIVGGVNLILSPEVTVDFCQAGMLSDDGRCRTFDAEADGYVRGEGCGVVILKRLSDALEDGDRVLATLRGSALNQDGRSSGLTAPNGPAQEAVVRAALNDAGLEPDDIGYVEAHGTGTPLGDPIEAQALGAVFATGSRVKPLLVASVKTNLGHLEAAAGVTGLIRTVEVLRYGQVPAHLHLQTPNPHIPWTELPLDVPTDTVPLPATGGARRAGVSSFGFSGTNAHLILEEAPPSPPRPRGDAGTHEGAPTERTHHLLALSAASEEALGVLAERYVAYLGRTDDAFPDICFTANTGRAHFRHRMTVVAEDSPAAAAAIAEWLESGSAAGVRTGGTGSEDRSAIAFRFPNLSTGDPDVVEAQVALSRRWQGWGVHPDLVAAEGGGHLAAVRVAGDLDVPMLSGLDGALVPQNRMVDAEFLETAVSGPSSDLEKALRREEVGHVIDIDPARSDPLLEVLAALHVDGLDPDWVAFEGGRARRKVSLPTHPFLRRHFWLDDAIVETASPWDAARSGALERSGLAPIDINLASYPGKWAALADFSHAVGRNALVALGAFDESAGRASLDGVMERAEIDPLYRPIVARWLAAIEEDGVLEREDGEWRWTETPSRVEVESIRERVEERMADDPGLLRYVLHSSSLVESILAGRESPLSTLFPDGSFDLASKLYEGAGQLRYVNGIAAAALRDWIAARPPTAPVRVLEIGAGTGGTTSSLVPLLPDDRARYDYTDVSDVFLEWGADKFSGVEFLRTRPFDVEVDPRTQGLEPGGYDIVVASNVLHAVRDLRAVLRTVRSLLAPGGMLVLVESTGHLEWHDVTTGMIEGWQHFEDDLRSDGPLLEVPRWLELFSETGFDDAAAFPPADSPASVLRQHILLATVTGAPSVAEDSVAAGDSSATGAGQQERTSDSTQVTSHQRADSASSPASESDAGATSAPEVGSSAIESLLADAVGTERDEVVMEAVRECVMEILRSDPDRPPSRDARLMELGVDSLMAVRLGKLLRTRLGLAEPLPSTLIFDYPTIRGIAELIRSRVEGSSTAEEVAPRGSPSRGGGAGGGGGDPAHGDRESEVAELSEEEVEEMLLKRLEDEESR